MQIVVRNPCVSVRTLLRGLEGTILRRHPGEIVLTNWAKWDLSEPDPLPCYTLNDTI